LFYFEIVTFWCEDYWLAAVSTDGWWTSKRWFLCLV